MLTVLIADDEPHIVELVRLTLEDPRVHVVEARDGSTALACAEAFRPDLILLDVHLPDVDGFKVCTELRECQGPAVKIVMLTAAAQEADIARGLAAGADHYLTKPFSPVRLLSLVETLLPTAPLWLRD